MFHQIFVGIEQNASDAVRPTGALVENPVDRSANSYRKSISDKFSYHLRWHVVDVFPTILLHRLCEVMVEFVQEDEGRPVEWRFVFVKDTRHWREIYQIENGEILYELEDCNRCLGRFSVMPHIALGESRRFVERNVEHGHARRTHAIGEARVDDRWRAASIRGIRRSLSGFVEANAEEFRSSFQRRCEFVSAKELAQFIQHFRRGCAFVVALLVWGKQQVADTVFDHMYEFLPIQAPFLFFREPIWILVYPRAIREFACQVIKKAFVVEV